jgi:N,N-dimethylformamidase
MADDAGDQSVRVDFGPVIDNQTPLLIAAWGGAAWSGAALAGTSVGGHYNGKIEHPMIIGAALNTAAAQTINTDSNNSDDLIASWDFTREISSSRIVDTGPHSLHGELINLPARAMKGSNWNGTEMCWQHAPEQYGAIHFHDDDIYDCGWETDFSFTVPDNFNSGVYAVRLQCGDAEDMIPFFVRPPKDKTQSDICVLIPVFTYTVYANYMRFNTDDDYRARAAAWGARPWTVDDHPDYGLSTYNFHSDGSGICYSSRLRPVINMRSALLSYVDPKGSGLRHFPADTHLFCWLETTGHNYDVITDEDLDAEGVDLLNQYKVVLTTTHPEYHTPNTLNTLTEYTQQHGGRLMYLGGNGFYWKVALNPDYPGAVEIRRGEGGIRAWAAEPGEYYNSFDGQYGGMWRRNDRPPQRLAGVGFTSQGIFDGSYYRRQADAANPRAAWIFEGVDDEILGDFGLSGGGAAGFELDRMDYRLGSPLHSLVLATSENHNPDNFVVVPEELLTHLATCSGEPMDKLIRSDMVYFETANGGAVFSVGSITFCGSLLHNSCNNNISRIINNVLTRFRTA